MSYIFPIAQNAKSALETDVPAARTKAAAKAELKIDFISVDLETEWLTVSQEEAEPYYALAEAKPYGDGFMQRYEDAEGRAILAVTYWKYSDPNSEPAILDSAMPAPDPQAVDSSDGPLDHTDDLYFRLSKLKKKRRRTAKKDTNQMDLFGAPTEPSRDKA